MAELIVIAHFVGDWIFQSRYIAQTKSERIESLAEHLFYYGFTIGTVAYWFVGVDAIVWALINVILHGLWDWNYYRFGKKFMKTQGITTENYTEKKLFWDSIAIDQAFHLTTLIFTLRML
jgi:hypothetical protein